MNINQLLEGTEEDKKTWLNAKGFYQYYNPNHWVTKKLKCHPLGFNFISFDYTNYGFKMDEAIIYQVIVLDNNGTNEDFRTSVSEHLEKKKGK